MPTAGVPEPEQDLLADVAVDEEEGGRTRSAEQVAPRDDDVPVPV
jgi:hypothetical protein